jgi:hypothetical protein
MAIAHNHSVSSARSKHFAVSSHYIREAIDRQIVRLQWVQSADNVADFLTKPLAREALSHLLSLCNVG